MAIRERVERSPQESKSCVLPLYERIMKGGEVPPCYELYKRHATAKPKIAPPKSATMTQYAGIMRSPSFQINNRVFAVCVRPNGIVANKRLDCYRVELDGKRGCQHTNATYNGIIICVFVKIDSKPI